MSRALLLPALLLVACESVVAPPEQGSAGTGTGPDPTTTDGTSAATSAATSATSSTSGASDPGPSTGRASTSTGMDVVETDNAFLLPPDVGSLSECTIWSQDCPAGQKCTPWANDGGSSPNAFRCVPVVPDPDGPGEACTLQGPPASGLDTCEFGAVCWDVDPETGEGTCVPHCAGSEQGPYCADPSRTCTISGDGFTALCRPTCDPLADTPCTDTDLGCYPLNGSFVCVPDASGDAGAEFEPCEFANDCDAGLLCADPDVVGDACGAGARGCCLQPCDLAAPDCPAMTSCISPFEDGTAQPGYESVGVCGTP